MYTSLDRRRYLRRMAAYAAAALFCGIFFLVYDRFSHGVRSFYMTFCFLPPAVACAVNGICALLRLGFSRLGDNLFGGGIGLITAGFVLRGILEIAGSDSAYLPVFFIGGGWMIVCGIIVWIYYNRKRKGETDHAASVGGR